MSAYLNAASHARPTLQTIERMREAFDQSARLDPAALAVRYAEPIAEARRGAAALLNADTASVGFSSTTSAAWLAIAARLPMDGGRVLIAPHEWGAFVRFLRLRERQGAFRVETLPALHGEAALSAWAARLDDDVVALFAPMASSIDGLRYPIEAIGALDRPPGCRFIVDAAQAVGQIPVDTRRLGADAIVATGRKWLRGPRGVALFWLSERLAALTPVAEVEIGDIPAHLRVGVGAAIEQALAVGVETIETALAERRARGLAAARRIGLELDDAEATGPRATGALTLGAPAAARERLEAGLTASGFTVKFPDRAIYEPEAPSSTDAIPMRISAHLDIDDEDLDAFFARVADLL